MDMVYYFPIDAMGEEVGTPIPVPVRADGKVDLSGLPTDFRETLEHAGAPDEMRLERVFPRDGEEFLRALLRMNNGYIRFRAPSATQPVANPFAV